jgi:hypothetical protein
LALIANDRFTREIASDLAIGFKTIACHRHNFWPGIYLFEVLGLIMASAPADP